MYINNTDNTIIDSFPKIDKELIESLRELFPDKLPDLQQGQRIDDYGLGFLYGHRDVIDKLQVIYDYQQEENK